MAGSPYTNTMDSLRCSAALKEKLRHGRRDASGIACPPESPATPQPKQTLRKSKIWRFSVAAAALLVLAAGVGIPLSHGLRWSAPSAPLPVPGVDLPLLTLPEESPDGFGFEGYMAYDVSDLVNGNPWTEDANLASMPVFRNPAVMDLASMQNGFPTGGLSAEEALAQGREAAEKMAYAILAETIHPTEEEKQAYAEKTGQSMPQTAGYSVSLECDKGTIDVEASGLITVWPNPTVSLPTEYYFGHFAPLSDMEKTLAYLGQQYSGLAGMEQATPFISGGDYNIYAQQGYSIGMYEGTGDLTQQIVQYHFNTITFFCDDAGDLFIIRRYRADLSDKVGDYPILTPKEAKDLLLEGHYITTVPEEMPGANYVVKTELVYRTDAYSELFLPYYRFYVEMPGMERENGLNTYGAYYVPAVRPEYIANLPLWDGRFN